MKASTIIRLILSGVIIYFVYKETGIATTIFAITITIFIELNGIHNKLVFKRMNEIQGIPDKEVNTKPKSKWQQRIEEIQKAQDEQKAKRL